VFDQILTGPATAMVATGTVAALLGSTRAGQIYAAWKPFISEKR